MKLSTLTIVAILGYTTAVEYCPPTGPLLPVPISSPSSGFNAEPLRNALSRLTNDSAAAFDTSATSFSLTITTLDDQIFQFHHTAEKINQTGVTEVNGDTIYRLASVSKLFTVLSLMLQDGLDIDDFVWKHVPELVDVDDFRNVTLRMLASHVSGILRDGFVFDLVSRASPEALYSLGFPNVTLPSDYPTCDSALEPLCSREEFISGILRAEPIWLPGRTPTYSNYAFVLLGYAVESFSGKSLKDVFADEIIRPLGLSSATGLQAPNRSAMIIPEDAEVWSTLEFGNWKATGGVFATPNDLSSFVRGILNSKLLSQTQTVMWLKPSAYTSSSSGGAVGMPWSILRPVNISRPSGKRPIEIYTMLGGIPFYGAYVALIPEYQIGITINIAGVGDDLATRTLLDIAIQHVVPAFDNLARVQAEKKYVGSYRNATGDDETDSSIVLVLDDGPGLKVQEWKSNGKAVSDAWVAISGESVGWTDSDIRIYPVGGEGERWQVAFRGIAEKNETGIFQTACDTWFNFNQFRYAGFSVDEIKFNVSEDGKVRGLEIPGLRQNLAKE